MAVASGHRQKREKNTRPGEPARIETLQTLTTIQIVFLALSSEWTRSSLTSHAVLPGRASYASSEPLTSPPSSNSTSLAGYSLIKEIKQQSPYSPPLCAMSVCSFLYLISTSRSKHLLLLLVSKDPPPLSNARHWYTDTSRAENRSREWQVTPRSQAGISPTATPRSEAALAHASNLNLKEHFRAPGPPQSAGPALGQRWSNVSAGSSLRSIFAAGEKGGGGGGRVIGEEGGTVRGRREEGRRVTRREQGVSELGVEAGSAEERGRERGAVPISRCIHTCVYWTVTSAPPMQYRVLRCCDASAVSCTVCCSNGVCVAAVPRWQSLGAGVMRCCDARDA
eukprot:3609930-Rhodomonas_salina.3